MPLTLTLCLDERAVDRVIASVHLAPETPGHAIEGVALQLFDAEGEPLSPKLLLPVAGALIGPLSSRVELRTDGRPIPAEAEVVVTAWWPGGQVQARRTTDPGTELAAHVRAEPEELPAAAELFEELDPAERARLVALFPWIVRPPPKVLELTADPPAADLADAYALDEEDAEWLASLADE